MSRVHRLAETDGTKRTAQHDAPALVRQATEPCVSERLAADKTILIRFTVVMHRNGFRFSSASAVRGFYFGALHVRQASSLTDTELVSGS